MRMTVSRADRATRGADECSKSFPQSGQHQAGGGLAISASRPGADRSDDREGVVKAPQSAAGGSANASLEPTICQKRKVLIRETGRMSWALSR